MTSLLIHAALGVLCLALFFYFNADLYRSAGGALRVSALEILYYLIAVCSVSLGWYFNVQYVYAFPEQASWVHFTRMLFTNPAASSGSQDLLITNAILFPLWTIIDGRRRGLKQPWIYFVLSLFTSFGFAMALYLAALERRIRQLKAASGSACGSAAGPRSELAAGRSHAAREV